MNESKWWVHWHPDGYGLTKDGRPSARASDWYLWYAPHYAITHAEYSLESAPVKECEVITYEDAVQRLAQAGMKTTAEELPTCKDAVWKLSPEPGFLASLTPEQRATALNAPDEAETFGRVIQPNDGIANPTEDRMMVEFRLDPAKYRVRVRPSGNFYRAFVQTREPDALIGQCTSDVATMAVGIAIEYAKAPPPGRLLPHPWKRPDGSHIKASWEE